MMSIVSIMPILQCMGHRTKRKNGVGLKRAKDVSYQRVIGIERKHQKKRSVYIGLHRLYVWGQTVILNHAKVYIRSSLDHNFDPLDGCMGGIGRFSLVSK